MAEMSGQVAGNKEAAEKFCADHPGSSVHQGNIGSNADCERVGP